MDKQFFVTGYHKSRLERATKIVQFKSFTISTGDTMWLGDGIYFWDTLEDAKWWNEDIYVDGAILSAQLTCDYDNFLDLDTPVHMSQLVAYVDAFKAQIAEDGTVDLDFQNAIQIRAFFCTLYKKDKGIQLMKHSFPWLKKNSAGFKDVYKRTQYCATSNEIIDNIKFVAKSIGGRLIGENNEYI